MRAPTMLPLGSMRILTNLPKRDELLLRAVLALPNASSTGLDCRMASARVSMPPPLLERHAR